MIFITSSFSLLTSSVPILFLPAIFKSISLHSTYFKSHCSQIVLPFRLFRAIHLLPISTSFTFLRAPSQPPSLSTPPASTLLGVLSNSYHHFVVKTLRCGQSLNSLTEFCLSINRVKSILTISPY